MSDVIGFAGKPEHLHPSSVSNSRTDEITRLRAELAKANEGRDKYKEIAISETNETGKLQLSNIDSLAQITRLRADLAAVTAERDRMREALRPFDDFPLHKWDGIGDDHVLYGPFTLGHVRKYLSASCQAILDNSNYPEKPDSCARAAIEGVKEPASPKGETHGQ